MEAGSTEGLEERGQGERHDCWISRSVAGLDEVGKLGAMADRDRIWRYNLGIEHRGLS